MRSTVVSQPQRNARHAHAEHAPASERPPTARQLRALGLLLDGLSNKEIASFMGITSAGAKKHIDALMRRFGVSRRTTLVRAALERRYLGMVPGPLGTAFVVEPVEGLALTPPQRGLLELAARGLKDREIARQTGISERTVRFHFANVRRRLGAANRAQAVAIATGRRLLESVDR